MTEISIVVVSPSGIERSRISRALGDRPSIRLIAMASDLSEAFTVIEASLPDVVLFSQIACALPGFDGMLDLITAINAHWLGLQGPGACLPRDDSQPLAPGGTTGPEAVHSLEELLERISACGKRRPKVRLAQLTHSAPPTRSDKIILIGASTGGIDALTTVLAEFPSDCPPTAIVQHTGRGFSQSLVRLFARLCAARVVAAEDGLVLEQGMVCIAGGIPRHLRLTLGEQLTCKLGEGPEVSGQIPAVDVLFRSAVAFAPRTIAVLLTGMGSDGAAGLLDLRRAGGITIGQDKATSVVYGMPRVAQELGAVQHQLALPQIGATVIQMAQGGQTVSSP